MPAVTRAKEDSDSPPEDELETHPCIAWSGVSRKIPVLLFHAEALVLKDGNIRSIGEKYNLGFKIVRTESRLVRGILVNHGFHEVHPNSNDYNLMWTGTHLKTYLLRTLQDFQRVNHFPRSHELTRKDRLYKNIQRMQQTYGFQNFHIVPQTFVLPAEYQEFCNYFSKDKGPWIIKPVASSRGRGIYLVSSPSQIPMEENLLVSRYINNPLLIDDFKFDVRLYVLVTSYDPIIIYVYEEGLARFATVKYDHAMKNIKNQFMHLTNYSVNKKSSDYVSCDDPEVEDYGNKWSMSAMLRYLRQEGKDTTLLMGQIEDLIIKAVLSAEIQIATACKMFVPHRNNCFELYGFDVLIDSNLKPWLLEVNLSPSLACDAPLDLKIKASMISDMFSLVGFVCQDPVVKQMRSDKAGLDSSVKNQTQKTQRSFSAQSAKSKVHQRPLSATDTDADQKEKQGGKQVERLDLTAEEAKVLRRTQEEHERRGGFIRIFPTPQTWELYSGYLEYKTSMNSMLANKLFHGRSEKTSVASKSRNKLKGNVPSEVDSRTTCHVVQYERKLLTLEARRRRQRRSTGRATTRSRKAGQGLSPSSPHSSENEEGDEGEEQEPQETQEKKPAHSDPRPSSLQTEEPFLVKVRKPKVDLLNILQQGWDLSKVQARMAFSSYLHRVQMRLLAESRANSSSAWQEKDNDQMELVMRFLKRAASNLQQDMRVVLPSRQLSLPDRQRILSHQLGEFIQCYNKETEQMVKSLEKIKDDDRCINPNVFQEFILEASESDLEEVLTFYTHKNKSASVFLGTKCQTSNTDSSKECRKCSGESAKPHGRKTLMNAKEGSSAPESSVSSAKASQAKNEEIQDATQPGESKIAVTLSMAKLSNSVQKNRDNKHSSSNIGGNRSNKGQSGDAVFETELQAEAFASNGTKNNENNTGITSDGDHGSNKPHSTKIVRVSEVQPEIVQSCKVQARLLASQHTSSYPAVLDCEHIHLQHCFPPSVSELQPPPYIQPPPHPHADPQNKPQTAVSSTSSTLQPTRVMWASSRSNTAASDVLQRLHASRSDQPPTYGIPTGASSSPAAVNVHNQKLSRPSSAGQLIHKASKPRPGSALVLKEPDLLSSQAQSNQQAIVTALKRLVEKQAARQYSTSSHISLLTQHLTNLNLANGVFSRGGLSLTSGVQPGTLTGAGSHRNDSVGDGERNLATGATQQQNHQLPSGSYQLQFAIQQLQQQKLQSRQLLEQSRTRHQAMLAGHTLVPAAVPRNCVPNSSAVQVQSRHTLNQPANQGTQGQTKGQSFAHGVTVLTPKPPTTVPRDGLSRKTATQRFSKQTPSETPSSNGISGRHIVYDTSCGKTGLSVYSKLFQTHGTNQR
ncbi:tubulin polyglutamylase TTLL5 isoform X1 [Astyanax mexicanus]|uniref:tubulin polyglutamylase TTLL5 isoform X1 n=1 Tax=Astyanax mexicanus TaxID=7994 RepID=UPI0020CB11FB|nr:tubulin polyglutamylase TTLL5 isoform X1 [Astyanax mexicanus]